MRLSYEDGTVMVGNVSELTIRGCDQYTKPIAQGVINALFASEEFFAEEYARQS